MRSPTKALIIGLATALAASLSLYAADRKNEDAARKASLQAVLKKYGWAVPICHQKQRQNYAICFRALDLAQVMGADATHFWDLIARGLSEAAAQRNVSDFESLRDLLMSGVPIACTASRASSALTSAEAPPTDASGAGSASAWRVKVEGDRVKRLCADSRVQAAPGSPAGRIASAISSVATAGAGVFSFADAYEAAYAECQASTPQHSGPAGGPMRTAGGGAEGNDRDRKEEDEKEEKKEQTAAAASAPASAASSASAPSAPASASSGSSATASAATGAASSVNMTPSPPPATTAAQQATNNLLDVARKLKIDTKLGGVSLGRDVVVAPSLGRDRFMVSLKGRWNCPDEISCNSCEQQAFARAMVVRLKGDLPSCDNTNALTTPEDRAYCGTVRRSSGKVSKEAQAAAFALACKKYAKGLPKGEGGAGTICEAQAPRQGMRLTGSQCGQPNAMCSPDDPDSLGEPIPGAPGGQAPGPGGGPR